MSIWLTTPEIMALPVTGAPFDAVKKAATGTWKPPDISDQDSTNDTSCLAGALYAVRTGDAAIRQKTQSSLLDVIDSESGGRTLALGRNLAAYVTAADILGFKEAAFTTWVRLVRHKTLDGMTLIQCHEKRANNWGVMAGMSRIASAIYLNDTEDLARAAYVLRGWLGDRTQYTGFKYGGLEWQSDKTKPVGVNPKGATIQGKPVDGVLPDDQRRSGGFKWPPVCENYVRGSIGPMLVSIEMLRRNGYQQAEDWSDAAPRRAVEWFVGTMGGKTACAFSGDDAWQPYLARSLYPGLNCPGGSPAAVGKPWAWTAYTHH